MTETLNTPTADYQLAPPSAENYAVETAFINKQTLVLDPELPIAAAETYGVQHSRYNVDVIGRIELEPDAHKPQQQVHAAVIRFTSKDTEGQAVYALQPVQPDGEGGYKRHGKPHAIPVDGGRLIIGRKPQREASDQSSSTELLSISSLWPEVTDDTSISRSHLEVSMSNGRVAIEDYSTNGTIVEHATVPTVFEQPVESASDAEDHVFSHTYSALSIARERGMIQDGKFAGHEIMTRDTFPIVDAVDIRSWVAGAEAIIVNAQGKNGEQLSSYERLLRTCMDRLPHDVVTEQQVIKAIYDTVAETLEYDLDFADQLSEYARNQDEDNRVINLDYYLASGKGVCRHMALAVGWLGSQLAQKGYLSGKTTAEVNQNTSTNAAHEWARYTSPTGRVYILDPAQQFYGEIGTVLDGNSWNYFRPGEEAEYRAKAADRLAAEQPATFRSFMKRVTRHNSQ